MIRCGLASLLVTASLLGQSLPPSSPKSDSSETPIKLEAFTVTGSNIRRTEGETALPMTTIDRDAMEARDASTPIDLLSSLSEVLTVPLNENLAAASNARGDESSIALRGLSTGNTLVLLNGRRLSPHPISPSESTLPALSTNVNQLPNRGVDRIELLRDGASSIYGTDAVAGVVNAVMQRNYRGAEINVRFGDTSGGGGREYRATVLLGKSFANGKGHLLTTFDYLDRAAVFASDRSFSVDADQTSRAPAPWNDVLASTNFFGRSSGSAYGQFNVGTLSASGAFTPTRPTTVAATLAATTGVFYLVPTNATGGVGFKTATPVRTGVEREYYYNTQKEATISPQSRRYSWYGSGEYQLAPKLTAFTELNFYRADSNVDRSPDSYAASTDAVAIVPATNPWNPFGTRFYSPTGAANADGTLRLTGTPSPVALTNKRFPEFGTRTASVTSSVYRAVAGLRGRFGDTWQWESAALYSRATTTDVETGTTRESLFVNALNQTDPAKAFNPFSYEFAVQNGTLAVTKPYVNPRSILDTFAQPFRRDGATQLVSWDVRASGELFKLWGGNVASAAAGGDIRYETYDSTRPPFSGQNPASSGLTPTDNDFLAISPAADTHAHRNIKGLYAEVALPLVGKNFTLPLVQSFEVNASVRHDVYAKFGGVTKPKTGVAWRPTRWLMGRASYNEGFLAPNLAQLFNRDVTVTNSTTDTYRGSVTGLASDGSVNRLFRRAGNPNLRPEKSTGKSAGVVVDVPMVKGLSFSVDYWEIRQRDLLGTSGTTTSSVPEDNDALVAATQAALARGTPINQIDLGSGTPNYQGDAGTIRNLVTQADRDAFAAYNATRAPSAQRATVGTIAYIRQDYINKSLRFQNGFDFGATYRFPEYALGRLTLATEWSRLNSAFSYTTPTSSRDSLRWENGFAKWRGNASVTWRRKSWQAGFAAYYVGNYQDTGATTTAPIYTSLNAPKYIAEVFDTGLVRYRYVVSDSITYNAYLSYNFRPEAGRWLNGTSVRVGVINLADKEPPLSSSGYDASVYNAVARGRAFSVQLGRKF